MNEQEQLYLIASFPSWPALERAARTLPEPTPHVAVLNSSEAHGYDRELESDIELDDAQRERLAWHREHSDRPLLAVRVMAAEGRTVRRHLTAQGGEMLSAPTISSQAADVDYDPGMESDEPDLPPNNDRIYAPN